MCGLFYSELPFFSLKRLLKQMSSFRLRIVISAILLFSFTGGYLLMRRMQVHQAVYDICDLVEEKFYLSNPTLEQWSQACRASAKKLSLFATRAQIRRLLQDQMDMLHVSHFMIYSPVEDQKLWKGQAEETGLKTRWMEDHLIVFEIVEDSPAEKAGFRLGDELLTLNGDELQDQEIAATRGGEYGVLRDGRKIAIKVSGGVVQLDSQPKLKRLDDRTALITLSSFRSEYFEDAPWKQFVQTWKPYSRLIFDLRENSGGNLVSMLRALSPLFCHPTVIGELKLPRRSEDDRQVLTNDLSDDVQINQIDSSSAVSLETFEGYGCYQGAVVVLIGPHTSSVSEIFSSALLKRSHAKVMGQPTSGDVVLAVWYDLPTWGKGYSISIPEALYLTTEGRQLEGEGVYPQKEIFDDLKVWRQGKDSWIHSALMSGF